jgi:hypothetical protein
MNTLSYESYLGASNGSAFGGEILPQGTVTDQCHVNSGEYMRRMNGEGRELYDPQETGAKPVDASKFRVFEHELCLSFIDNLGHQPVLMNFDTRAIGASKTFTRKVYESAGMSSTKLAAFPVVFSSLNSVKVEMPVSYAATMFPEPETYDAFYIYINRTIAARVPREVKEYFPLSYYHFLSHFAFKLIGTAKTNDHYPTKRTDIPVNIGGMVWPHATKRIGPHEVVEWYLPFPDEIRNYNEIVKYTGNDPYKILVGLRPSILTYINCVMSLIDEMQPALEADQKFKLKLVVETFIRARVVGESQRTAVPGTPCYTSVCRGPYCL